MLRCNICGRPDCKGCEFGDIRGLANELIEELSEACFCSWGGNWHWLEELVAPGSNRCGNLQHWLIALCLVRDVFPQCIIEDLQEDDYGSVELLADRWGPMLLGCSAKYWDEMKTKDLDQLTGMLVGLNCVEQRSEVA